MNKLHLNDIWKQHLNSPPKKNNSCCLTLSTVSANSTAVANRAEQLASCGYTARSSWTTPAGPGCLSQVQPACAWPCQRRSPEPGRHHTPQSSAAACRSPARRRAGRAWPRWRCPAASAEETRVTLQTLRKFYELPPSPDGIQPTSSSVKTGPRNCHNRRLDNIPGLEITQQAHPDSKKTFLHAAENPEPENIFNGLFSQWAGQQLLTGTVS